MTEIKLNQGEVAQVRYKLWKIQQRAKSDTTLYNWSRHIAQTLTKAERRMAREKTKLQRQNHEN